MLRVQLHVRVVPEFGCLSRAMGCVVRFTVVLSRGVAHCVCGGGLLLLSVSKGLIGIMRVGVRHPIYFPGELHIHAQAPSTTVVHEATVIVLAINRQRRCQRAECVGTVGVLVTAHPYDPVSSLDGLARNLHF